MSALTDCENCMNIRTKAERQIWGCGYEVAIESPEPWDHPGRKKGEHDPPIETCIGYTRNLPEVIETVRAHRHWRDGSGLSSAKLFFGDRHLSDEAVAGIEILDGAINEKDAWAAKPADKGGGAE